ncbi:MAG: hypothetical protein KGJ93_02240 [Patescibacteria group bacterium]|nr:hypothetical protein [Patescibacteria group bacterium]
MLKTATLSNFFGALPIRPKTRVIRPQSQKAGPVRLVLAMALLALNAFLLMGYIVSANSYSAAGYEMKALQMQLAQLQEDNKKMNLQVSEASSVISVSSDFASAGFVQAGTPQFLQVNQLSRR